MRDDLIIRKDGPTDVSVTEVLHDTVFGAPEGRRESLERELLRRLREGEDVIGDLTFVAELDGEVVGHVVCSRADLAGAPAVALGPMAVRADLQRQGIGAALLMAVVASADRIGEGAIVLRGDPEYYAFFGFVPGTRAGIRGLRPGPEDDLQVLALRAWRPAMTGIFRCAMAFEALD